MSKSLFSAILLALFCLCACSQSIPKEALELSHESLQDRQMQTRKFSTKNEKSLISAGAQVLQDMGFNIDESETKLGVVVASKDASAVNGGQVAAAVFVALLGGGAMPIDDHQKVRVSLVTRPTSKTTTNLRVTFQRIVWDNYGKISRVEALNEEDIYKEFFSKISKSIFLEAHQI